MVKLDGMRLCSRTGEGSEAQNQPVQWEKIRANRGSPGVDAPANVCQPSWVEDWAGTAASQTGFCPAMI
jgi:hypothetical protein